MSSFNASRSLADTETSFVHFRDLSDGALFLYDDSIWIKQGPIPRNSDELFFLDAIGRQKFGPNALYAKCNPCMARIYFKPDLYYDLNSFGSQEIQSMMWSAIYRCATVKVSKDTNFLNKSVAWFIDSSNFTFRKMSPHLAISYVEERRLIIVPGVDFFCGDRFLGRYDTVEL